MGNDLPKYFKEYMEQKFSEIHTRFDDSEEQTKEKLLSVSKDVDLLKENSDWVNKKIWMAVGGIAIIAAFGTYFAVSFKKLNELQLNAQLEPIKTDIRTVMSAMEDYDIVILE